jgi:hypothetical protein
LNQIITFQKIKPFIGAGLILLGLYLLVGNFIPVNADKYRKHDSKLTTLTAYLINPPQYFKQKGKNGRTFLRLELDQIVGVLFENENEFLDATDWEAVLSEINYHDTVTIKVLKERFDRFYVNKSSLSEFEKVINHPIERFSFYSLQFRGKEYVHDIYEAAKKRHKDNLVLSSIVYLSIIGAGAWTIKAKS